MSADDDTIFDLAMQHNLNEIVRFHNVVRGSLSEHLREHRDDKYARAALTNYDNYLSINTFLMIYSYFEEYLYLLWKKKAKTVKRTRSFSIKGYESVLLEFGVPLTNPSWMYMLKATSVRHCLLHANGRLSFMTHPPEQEIRAIVVQYPEELFIRNEDQLVIAVGFVRRFVDEVRNFRNAIAYQQQGGDAHEINDIGSAAGAGGRTPII